MINSHNTAQNGFHQTIRKVFTETPTHLTDNHLNISQGGDQNNNEIIPMQWVDNLILDIWRQFSWGILPRPENSQQHGNNEETVMMQVDQYIDNLWSNFIGDNNSQPESQSTDDQNNINQEQEVESGDEHVENVDVNIENVDEYIEKLWSDYIAA